MKGAKGWALAHDKKVICWSVRSTRDEVIKNAETGYKACWATLSGVGFSVVKVRVVPEVNAS